jgi:uncharacterized membrane protein YdjX (TVP38/TMEM64 family)
VLLQLTLSQHMKILRQINKHKDHLFFYVLFLLFTPVIPNWFVNISLPLFGIPIHIFGMATFFGLFLTPENLQLTEFILLGVMPQTFVAVKAGLTIQSIQSPSEVIDVKVITSLFILAFLSVLPTLPPVQKFLGKFLTSQNEKMKKN